MLLGGDAPTDAPTLTPQRMEEILSQRGDYKNMQAAYASSLDTVARLEQQYGRSALIGWGLNGGIPSGFSTGRFARRKLPTTADAINHARTAST